MKFFLISLFVLMVAQSAFAGVLRVEKDGSGDFAIIQDAVDAAAAGDTILIGPGRFDTFHPCVAPGWTEDAIVSVTKDNLTFIGSGKGVTILGPVEYHGGDSINPKGFCSIDSYDGVIKEMTIENVEESIYWFEGRLDVEGCSIRALAPDFLALTILFANGSAINCEFEFSDVSTACLLGSVPIDFLVQNCRFMGWGYGVKAVNGAKGIHISGCTFDESYYGIVFDGYSEGAIFDCSLKNISYVGVSIGNASNADLALVFPTIT